MYNRFFFLPLFIASLFFTTQFSFGQASSRDFYELKVYHIANQQQEERVDTFLKNAYLPALKRAGVKDVGVFKPVEDSPAHGKKIYVYTPYASAEMFMELPEKLENDKRFKRKGSEYLNASHDNPPYERIETILMKAFEGTPHYKTNDLKGPVEERIYELRSYEGATEQLYMKKVQMFNEGESDIFERLTFHPIFFAEVIAGSRMPNLMYMTSFSNMASRDAHWDAFRTDSKWEEMKVMEEYQNTVSHADIILLHPTEYSTL